MDNINWYPGHMTKARRMMEENIRLVDLVIEIIDARVPLSSRNPDIDTLGKGKARVLVMGKADLADPAMTEVYRRQFQSEGYTVLAVDAREKKLVSRVRDAAMDACKDKIERDRRRGMVGRPIRAMICGIPNVGKSTLINSLAGKASAKTGNKPGVTKGKQWITIGASGNALKLEILDTPGILWPKFEDPEVGVRLALVGSIGESILDEEGLSAKLMEYLLRDYPELLTAKYGRDGEAIGNLEDIARCRNLLLKGDAPDLSRAAHLLLDDFKNGRVGRVTLDREKAII